MTDDIITFLRARLDEDERVTWRVLTWPDDQCQPQGREILFRHDQWVRRAANDDGPDQIVRTATEHEGQLPEDWNPANPVPEGWIQPHAIAFIADKGGSGNLAQWLGDHIARHDPARVLADITAKRAIVERCAQRIASHDPDGSEGAWEMIHDDAWATLNALATPYAQHPDYQQEWNA